ncbi:MAG: Nif3-like dinuclear metal center hexameric protein [Bacteroidetes bacterium]|nr:Nif3-like dinuclear metal center hexameric protein [Bacteroidota bacterium]
MLVKNIVDLLDAWAPTATAESFDNTGLLVGNLQTELTGVLIAHDSPENVIDEAIQKKCNLVVAYHPIIFSGLKKTSGTDYVTRAVVKAIKNDIAIYALHTALDNQLNGTNLGLAKALKLQNPKILIPTTENIFKLITYVPESHAENVRQSLFEAGAGNIGNYDQCSFSIRGEGTFRAGENTAPFIGEKGKTHTEKEVQIGVVFHQHHKQKILKSLNDAHPYEEVAYELYQTHNTNQDMGMGMVGTLATPFSQTDFVKYVKDQLQLAVVRHSAYLQPEIKTVAVLAGSGAFAIKNAIATGADALITGDLKYHNFFEADGKILLLDVGHYESEQFTKILIRDFLVKKFTNFAPAFSAVKIELSEINTNPIKYA